MKILLYLFVIFMIGDSTYIVGSHDRYIILDISNSSTDSCLVTLGNLNKKLIRFERCYKLRKYDQFTR